MQTTYGYAIENILETTETGYTLASQDKLWTIFMFDVWANDSARYSRIFYAGKPEDGEDGTRWSYDMFQDEWVWTSYKEAVNFAASLQAEMESRATSVTLPDDFKIHVINWGDDARLERWVIGATDSLKTRFRASDSAIVEMLKMNQAWIQWMKDNEFNGE